MRKRKKRGKGRTEDAKNEMRRLTHSAIFTENEEREKREESRKEGKEKKKER